jgi:hypothetical protein
MRDITVACVYDSDLREEANRAGVNYWHEYVREVCDNIGLRAREVSRSILSDGEALREYSVLLVGDLAATQLPPGAAEALEGWVRAGGVLIGMGSNGLDSLFGNGCTSLLKQPVDDFTVAGFFSILNDPVTEGVHSYLHPSQKLMIFSDVRIATPQTSKPLARFYGPNGVYMGSAAITRRDLGEGVAFYFAFNVPKTLWVLQQGRPVDKDYDGDGYLRVSDASVIRPHEIEVQYADEIKWLLQNMIAVRCVPFIYPSPPAGGRVPDALFFWGGDDEGQPNAQVFSSDFMKERGLPYHLNIMPKAGRFALTPEEARRIEANGHEIALHFNVIDDRKHPYSFTEADVREQMDLFRKTFGKTSVCSVNHWCTWTGWADAPKWFGAMGGKGDNSRIHASSPPLNPANLIGFSFGTAFPHYVYDDWRGGNRRIAFILQPIAAYEVGYNNRADRPDFEHLPRIVELATRYHLTADMFYHPVNIHRFASCRSAIDEFLRILRERKVLAKHMGNDELCRWWEARSASAVGAARVSENVITFDCETDYEDGMVVKVPLGQRRAARVRVANSSAPAKFTHEFGQKWVFVPAPKGKHTVEVVTES